MTKQPISRFPVPDLAALPVDLQQLFQEVSEKAGFIPKRFLGVGASAGRIACFLGLSRGINAARVRPK